MAKVNCTNNSSKTLYAYRGESKTLKEWAEFLGFSYDTFSSRLRRGWSIKRAIEAPLGERPKSDRHSKMPEYSVWCGMIARCCNMKTSHFPRYGGRGIAICQRWRSSFRYFLEDMGPRPNGTSIDRMDNDGNYSCGKCAQCYENDWTANCRWATDSEQARNKRDSIRITIDGETKHIKEWCDHFGISYGAAKNRINLLGWTSEDAVKTPLNRKKNAKLFHYKGETKTASEFARDYSISYITFKQRLFYGWTISRTIETPVRPRKRS